RSAQVFSIHGHNRSHRARPDGPANRVRLAGWVTTEDAGHRSRQFCISSEPPPARYAQPDRQGRSQEAILELKLGLESFVFSWRMCAATASRNTSVNSN